MAATIKIKNSSTTGAVPTGSDLVQGELAVNVTDLGLYTENASGTVVKLNAPSIDDKNTGATKYLTIDTSGNLGLGVTPSAWYYPSLSLSNGSFYSRPDPSTGIAANAYSSTSGGGWKYIASAAATRYEQSAGAHTWAYAPSGTAGNAITFTQAMTLDASGNLGVGATSMVTKLTVNGSQINYGTNPYIAFSSLYNTTPAYLQFNTSSGLLSLFSLGTGTNGAINFLTGAGTEAARIDSSGNLLVGTTSSVVGGRIAGSVSGTGVVLETNGASGYYPAWFEVAGTQKGYITTTTGGTTYNTTSDYRLKENIAPMVGALEKVAALKPCTYTWKEDGSSGQGFIAHELAEVVPECVSGEKDGTFENGTPLYQGIDTSFLVATLTAAIQEQQAIIEGLTARITALEQA